MTPTLGGTLDLFEYLETELSTFDEKPLNAVDSAALTQFCMVRSEGIAPELRDTPKDGLLAKPQIDFLAELFHTLSTKPAHFSDYLLAERYSNMFTGLDPNRVKREIAALNASPRFRDLGIRDYSAAFDEDAHLQFSATTFVWRSKLGRNHDFAYVGFRGTDDSFTGWREDFDMAATPPVVAQDMAVEYLEAVARHTPSHIYVGGHSKGGNLATYAALRCSDAVRRRIVQVFDHDGPGFKEGFVTEKDYAQLKGRITRIVPEESVVGMLMESHAPTLVVKSTAHGIDQHSVFTWEIEDGDFDYADDLSDSAKFTHDVMSGWLSSLSEEETPAVVDALFKAIEFSGAETAGEVFAGNGDVVALLTETTRNMDEETREVLRPALAKLATVTARRTAQGVANAAANAAASALTRLTGGGSDDDDSDEDEKDEEDD